MEVVLKPCDPTKIKIENVKSLGNSRNKFEIVKLRYAGKINEIFFLG